ncbi:hypothetical protein WJX74_010909 [Apatococcus lobatus]|uniref:Uncharacterized protein n=1 Tax=Apatococcus lobatus TaxID=904363 RepID=A0AAW1R1D2_9CHLO
MGAGAVIAAVAAAGGSALAFLTILAQQRALPPAVWAFAASDKSGAKARLQAGATSLAFVPKLVVCPPGLSLKMKLQNADSSLTTLAVGAGSTAKLDGAISPSQTVASLTVAAA